MADNELTTKLKEVIDMGIFSRLLEMDHSEERDFSSLAVYGFLEAGENTVGDMVEALNAESQARF
ncbi:hypothetical protein PENFLA_c095G11032 [Penicillium flavigenum]|uniref:Uncharacterized protein n=1 Tax=Penicillium flavigenum TaxID=254877 RepID=A0A1V6S895_9EURO|nr:hypothetical protein PENFLA_c095G11032 [Penicillium flavigenum]